ncbi:PREDICTED: sodium-coupled monocarboxylate transporter 2 [Thamnophis sirtalis]|uniref:Sodium-coupled monocarboxylate transporter 2 n=1 Tax=Thamnophis sirtalis TaxID=35019 RepID=A0A6I9YJX5_9SAUR|nr:PREDICTED: sodium-coupled monocarboxylate transporter 2 [Thamnophis sirtalis]
MGKFIPPVVESFVVWDYLVFAALFLVSSGIGIFFAIKERKKASSGDFLVGGRQMTCGPVALSLTASFMSAVTVLGTPAEVYRHGASFLLFAIAYTFVIISTSELFLPVFYRSGITSTYEYLELRFNKPVRMAATLIYILQTNIVNSVIYTEDYRTDSCQGFRSHQCFNLLVCYLNNGQLIVFMFYLCSFDFDPLRRHTFWTISVGGTFTWLGIYGVNQSTIQRCISCKTEKHAKLALYLNLVGLWAILVCAVLCGLVMYSFFMSCDPWTADFISAPDQLMPYFVMIIFSSAPGLPGLFVACAFSGTLSTVAASINALATVTFEDFVKNFFPKLSNRASTWTSKGLCRASLSIHGMCGGPMLGLFTLGIIFPCTNWKGAFGGLATGITLAFWVAIGAFVYPAPPSKTLPLYLSTAGCNSTDMVVPIVPTLPPERPYLADSWYSLSYLYYSAVGCLGCIIAGLLISFVTGPNKGKDIKPILIRPICNLFCFWSPKYKTFCWCGVDHNNKELQDELKIDFETKADANDGLKNGWTNNLPGYNPDEKSYTNTSLTESYF